MLLNHLICLGFKKSLGVFIMYRYYRFGILILVSSAMLLVGWLLVNAEYNERITDIVSTDEVTVGVTSERISGFLSEPAYMLVNLINDPSILTSLDDPVNEKQLSASLLSLASRDFSFVQVRWIDETGMERIRVNRYGDKIDMVDSQFLQNKKDRYYFQDSVSLETGKVYVSPLDLNIEHKTVEVPYRPTIRIAVPLVNSTGQNKGIFIINRDAAEVISLVDAASGQGQFLLTNQQGYWIRGFTRGEEWGFMFNRDDRVQRLSPQAWQAISAKPIGDIMLPEGIWTWATISPLGSARLNQPELSGKTEFYKIISFISNDNLSQIYNGIWEKFLLPLASGILLFGFLLIKLINLYESGREAVLRLNRSEQLRVAESRALQAEIESRLLIESSLNGILTVDEAGRIIMTNPRLNLLFGYQKDELLGLPVEVLVPDVLKEKHSTLKFDYLSHYRQQNMQSESRVVHGRRKDGVEIPVEISLSPILGAEKPKVSATVVDISLRVEAEKRLRLMAQVFENTADGIMITDAQSNIIEVNQAFTNITGFHEDEVKGLNPRFLQSNRHDEQFYQDMREALKTRGNWSGEIWNRMKSGKIHPEWLTLNQIVDENGEVQNYIAVYTDISQIKKVQQQLDHLAHHDPLSGLPNRLLLMERLDHAIKQSKRHQKRLAVMFIDLDFFKNINDSFGHQVGDKLLVQVTKRLNRIIRDEDVLSRIGGDEFIVLLENIVSESNAIKIAEKIIATFAGAFAIGEREISISSSIGISLFPQDGKDSNTLLQHADTAMYRAKEAGRNNFQFYTKELTYKAMERVHLENELRTALERGELYLLYQPQINLKTGKLIGMEALVRWQHAEMGLISPVKFIPVAEESGLILSLGEWVLRTACQQGSLWLSQGWDFGRISVNVAGPQLKRELLVDTIVRVLDETAFPENRLELEITESYIMEHGDQAIEQLDAIRKLGIRLSIDDFGTGYSSLAHLKELPIHKLKIDQSFIRDIPRDVDDMAITQAIIVMGKALNLDIIAEGVETIDQVQFLIEHGCQKAQGFFYSRPISAQNLEKKYCKRTESSLKLVTLPPKTKDDRN